MGVATSDRDRRWPGAIVPFEIANAPHKVNEISQAIAFYEKFTSFRFIHRSFEKDYITFTETSNHDPSGGNPVFKGTWKTIVAGHKLIPIGDNKILDWVPLTGATRVWKFDASNSSDPLTNPPVLEHTWQTIRQGHILSYIGSGQLLDWQPLDSSFSVWKIDREASGSKDLIPGDPLASGDRFKTINSTHRLIPLGSGVILVWQSAIGKFRLFRLDPKLPGKKPFDESNPLFDDAWQTIRDPHQIVPLGSRQVLDWNPANNKVRIWRLDIDEKGRDPLPGPVLWEGTWSWLSNNNVLMSLDNGQLLVWNPPTGEYSVRYVNLSGSHSDQVGREGGGREIFANAGAGVGAMLHEIGHSLGLFHEQERPDRDFYVVVHEDAIADGHIGNFDKVSEDESLSPTPYDFGSLMHYGHGLFSAKGEPTLTALGAFDKVIGLASMPSERDLRTLNVISDPLPGGPLTEGQWKSIDKDHELIGVGPDRVIDWEPETGNFRVWQYDPNARNNEDPLKGSAIKFDSPVLNVALAFGTWKTIRSGHQLVALDGDLILDWVPASGDFRLWQFDREVKGANDPLLEPPVRIGNWKTIRQGHRLANLGGRVIDWDDDGNYRVWSFDPKRADPLVGPPITAGTWSSINGDHELILLGDGNILDRDGGEYRIWQQDRSAKITQDPIGGYPLAHGQWKSIDAGHRLIPMGASQILDWQPHLNSSDFRVWQYGARFGAYHPDPLPGKPLFKGTLSQLKKGHEVVQLNKYHLLTWDTSSGQFDVWTLKLSGGGDAFSSGPLKSGTFDKKFDIKKNHQLLNVGDYLLLDFMPDSTGGGLSRVYSVDLKSDKLLTLITEHAWGSIGEGHELSSLGGGRVLDWVPDTGRFWVWKFDPKASGNADPLPNLLSSEAWGSIRKGHALVKIDTGHVIDWIPDAGWYRVYVDDTTAKGNFLGPLTLVEGFWQTIGEGHRMLGLSGAKVLEWEPANGNYRIWRFAVTSARS